MQTTLHEHILHLKDRIQALSNQLTSNRSRAEHERIESSCERRNLRWTFI